MEQSQAADAISQAIVVMSTENVPELVGLLKNSGSFVTQQSTQEELLDAAFKALKNSPQFRKQLGSYLINITTTDNGEYGNFADSDFSNYTSSFLNTLDKGKTSTFNTSFGTPSTSSYTTSTTLDTTTTKSGTKVGNLLRNIFTKENVDTLVKTGISYGATKLQDSANKSSEQRAIDYQIASAKASESQALLNAQNPQPSKNKWILPVGIGLGVILVGTIIYFAVKGGKKSSKASS
jgi:hypothetical protein